MNCARPFFLAPNTVFSFLFWILIFSPVVSQRNIIIMHSSVFVYEKGLPVVCSCAHSTIRSHFGEHDTDKAPMPHILSRFINFISTKYILNYIVRSNKLRGAHIVSQYTPPVVFVRVTAAPPPPVCLSVDSSVLHQHKNVSHRTIMSAEITVLSAPSSCRYTYVRRYNRIM